MYITYQKELWTSNVIEPYSLLDDASYFIFVPYTLNLLLSLILQMTIGCRHF